jgi:hypothetical protein
MTARVINIHDAKRPSSHQELLLLRKLSEACWELIKITEHEPSGIRDGDGRWSSSDAFVRQVAAVERLCAEIGVVLEREVGEGRTHASYDNHFGVCPVCYRSNGFLNVHKDHWFVCHVHKTKWHVGSNLFSSWKEENEKTWRKNEETLRGYTTVDPLPF